MASRELKAAIEAAQAAGALIRSLYRTHLPVRIKEDASPVTEADVRAEEVIRATLAKAFPGYGFYGEETGQRAMEAESIWLVDPIDGTKDFIRGRDGFSVMIGLLVDARPALGDGQLVGIG